METRTLLVLKDDGKKFRITIPNDAKVTFAPFSPPSKNGYRERGDSVGTLRIYKGTKDNCIGCFAGVRGFRDMALDYQEEVAVEEGATIWNSDQNGYSREEKVMQRKEWVEDELLALEPPKPKRVRGRKVS